MTTLGDTEATAVILDATQGAAAYDAAGAAAAAQSAAATDATTKANAAQAAAIAASQPVDSDLTAIAALTTTSYGRALLALADAAAARTALALGTAATHATGDYDAAGAAASAQAASQPIDSDLTAIAALTTTSYGRSLLEAANAAALRTLAGLGTLATQSGTFSGTSSGTNTGDQTVPALATTAAAIGTSAGGAASTASKGDHVHATGAGTPSTQAFGDAAATGTGPAAAMTDHKHAMPANPDGISWTLVTKGSDQSLNTSTTMTNDTALLFATVAGGLYQFECLLIYASPLGAGTPDIKIGGGEDATIRGIMNAFGWSVTDAVFAGGGGGIQTGTAAVTQGTAAAKRMARIFGTFLAVGGTFTIQWAQNVSNANDVTVYTGSVLMYRRIA